MKILLDAHVPSAVATQLQRRGIDAVTLDAWLHGNYRHATDDAILVAASSEARVLITYDTKTIPRLLDEWSREDRHHAGVVFVDERTILSEDVGGLVRALRRLVGESGEEDWKDRVDYLRRA